MPQGSRRCPQCQSIVAERVGGALCPACLLQLASSADRFLAWRVLAVVDSSAERTTYLAERSDAGGFLAVEVIAAQSVPGLSAEAFLERVASLQRLRHRGIPRVLDGRVTEGGDFCLVSEFVAGVRLARDRPTGALAPADGLRFFDRLCDAVGHAHARGVFHGRLQPERVLVVRDPEGAAPRLTGFDVRARAEAQADDVAGLGRVLAVLAAGTPGLAGLDALARRASDTAAGGPFPTVAALRDAVCVAAGQDR